MSYTPGAQWTAAGCGAQAGRMGGGQQLGDGVVPAAVVKTENANVAASGRHAATAQSHSLPESTFSEMI